MKPLKLRLVQNIVKEMDPEYAPDPEQAVQLWFMNIRPSGGMRLTQLGLETLLDLNFEHWAIKVDDIKTRLRPPQLLGLDRKMQNPYYIDYRKKQLVLFGSQDAMMLTLCGDIDGFLRTL